MLKKNKLTLIITSLVLLIPIFIGLLLWEQLPEQIPSHWNIEGEIDGWSSKPFAVFGLPCIILALHWVCIIASLTDPKSTNYHPTMFRLVLWICPGLSLLLSTLTYSVALGCEIDVEVIMPLVMGVLFLVIGNLLPKCRQSYTMGIKLPWTLNNEENWNKTHRFGGKVWVAGGIIILATAFIGSFWILMGVLLIMVTVPTLYSYLLYRKQAKDSKGE